MTRPRACARATTSAPSTARGSTSTTPPNARPPRLRRPPTRKRSPTKAMARSPPRSPRRGRSTLPRTTTSSISPRIRTATAASTARAFRARSASGSGRDRLEAGARSNRKGDSTFAERALVLENSAFFLRVAHAHSDQERDGEHQTHVGEKAALQPYLLEPKRDPLGGAAEQGVG